MRIEDPEHCRSLGKKALGLMFRTGLKRPLIFHFDKEQMIPLHMLFVFFPIDVLFLDENRKIVEIKKDFRPFTFYTPEKRAKYVVELKKGGAEKARIGERVDF
ncbi:MAG: DUF192 domain-containing protein [Nanobdellota archaeon]